MNSISNLKKLQLELKNNDIDIFIINRSDEFLSEYISPNAERLQFITNFSGSAGKAIILQNEAFLYVDGRYTFQASEQINVKEIKPKHLKIFWDDLKYNLNKKNLNIALDSKLHSISEIVKIKKITKNSSKIIFLEKNIIDSIWKDQPKLKYTDIFDHPIKYAGEDRSSKLKNVNDYIKENNLKHYLITGLDNIAWLLNIRADDILYTPLLFSYLLISQKEKPQLYVNEKKINEKLKKDLLKHINIHSIQEIQNIFSNIPHTDNIGLEFSTTTYYFLELLQKNKIKYIDIKNPCVILKAVKNKIEQKGTINAHIRDGVSITKFIYWLKNKMDIKTTDELSASKYLKKLRVKNELFHSLSFDTISAIGKNAALPHYRVTNKNNTKFSLNKIYLVDSGAQYYDGTTDVTRTIILGDPTTKQKEMFTRVLKGHIALANHFFKRGTKGNDIDYLARQSLQEVGCDYDHGTGHGIGSFLSVHEGPQRIAKESMFNNVELMPGMIISNEPGYYELNSYGIRTENLVLIKENDNNELYFENLTWCPIDTQLINTSLLTKIEKDWINHYHSNVYDRLSPYLSLDEKSWLAKVTEPIKFKKYL